MQCDNARRLMAEALDDCASAADDVALDAHLAQCRDCAAEWQQLLLLEVLFDAQDLDEPPADFAARVTRRLEAELGQMPAWQHSLMQIGLIVTGLLAALTGVAAVVTGFDVLVYGPIVLVWLGVLARGAQTALAGMWGGWTDGMMAWPLYLTLALAIALAWFGALVIPRAATSARRVKGA